MQRSRLTAFLLALASSSAAGAVTIPPSTMSLWQVKDIVLCSQKSPAYADWQAYQVVRVTASFTGPSTTINVNGFWDGKNIAPCPTGAQVFRVRFAPTQTGTWTFTIGNNQADAGLTVTAPEAGAITVNGAAPSPAGKTPRGFLRRDSVAGAPRASFRT